ncbi:unnamed protein product [Periconia digitata]|uniref:Cytochrome P450 n=1 Tax=Periconia digitata TaxID=1303443 RepID=A0A9W4XSQ6_9PLEO|nr:unnamed protein product [Periconia digitata]
MLYLALSATTVIAILVVHRLFTWQRNFGVAKSAGFPTFYSPVHTQEIWWLAIQGWIGPYIERLPRTWTRPWLPFARLWRLWHVGHEPFSEVGSDTLLLASPSGNTLWTCDAMIAKQLYSSPTVQTPVESLKFLNIWGPSISTVEGQEWRAHRRAVTNGFNSFTYEMAWEEAVFQTIGLVESWKNDENNSMVSNVQHWTLRHALHVLSGVLFNQRIMWQTESRKEMNQPRGNDRQSFSNALITVVSRVGLIMVTPRILLRLPVKGLQQVGQALADLTFYLESMRASTVKESEIIMAQSRKSLLESIVLAGEFDAGNSDSPHNSLPKDSILGDIFVTLLAGHDTTGNTLAFTILLLAVYPEHQESIQAELDEILGDRASDQWSCEKDYPSLEQGITGAFLKEVLRLYCPIEFGIRHTVAPTQITDSSGKQHTIPSNTTCVMNLSAASQNPSIWPRSNISDDSRRKLHNSHAIDFNPKRWLNEVKGTKHQMFWPFGKGYRKCPGRRFAQVSIMATIATLLKNHSIRLVVDEKTILAHGGNADQAHMATREKTICQLEDEVEVYLNVSMKGSVPVEIVPRTQF